MEGQDKVIGLLGGGQLGRMFIEEANRRNMKVNVLDATNSPAKQICAHDGHVEGSFSDSESIRKLARTCDVLTIEIEHVNADALEEVSSRVSVEPSPRTIRLIQNKLHQKRHLEKHEVPVAPYREVTENTDTALRKIGVDFGYPFMLKSQTQAYDGRGNFPVKSETDIPTALKTLAGRPLYAEKWSNFTKELAVMVVKTKDGVLSYPTVETVHEDSICKLVFAPARGVSREVNSSAQQLARKAIATFTGKGVFGVEMFLVESNEGAPKLLVNEIAPRPHNSGHYTIEACTSSQYDAHLRAILDLPLPPQNLHLNQPAIMLNILGGASENSHRSVASAAASVPGATVHLYGKDAAKPGRKMGHITVVGASMAECENTIKPLVDLVDRIRATRTDIPPSTMLAFTPSTIAPVPLIAICMGSQSDLPKVRPGLSLLQKLGVPFSVHVTSAHRTPDYMRSFARGAEARGFRVLVGAAGGAAHLPGMLASWTPLPVVGLPIAGSRLDGQDSLLSMVQMPRGEPVLTVGIDNAVNAALAAARIVGAGDERVREAVRRHLEEGAEAALESDRRLQEKGWEVMAKELSEG